MRPSASGLAARVGELLHRHGDRDDLSAAAVVPDARARRQRDVARRHRRRGRGREQRPQDRLRPARRPDGRSQAAGAGRLRAVVAVRPLIALATSWPHVLALRFIDRLGKGIRGSPRDAMLATLCDAANSRPRLRLPPRDGSRRRRDGPAASRRAFLYFHPGDYRTLFALTLIPGIIVILILLRVPGHCAKHVSSDLQDSRRLRVRQSTSLRPRACRSSSIARWPSSCCSAWATPATRSCCCDSSDLGVAAFWIPLLWSGAARRQDRSSLSGGAVVRPVRTAHSDRRSAGSCTRSSTRPSRVLRLGGDADRRLPRLRPLLRADRRSGEGVGRRPRAGAAAAPRSASTTPRSASARSRRA